MQTPPPPHALPQGPPQPGMMPGAMLSPDGMWRWDGTRWVPSGMGYAPPGFRPFAVFASAAQRANFALMALAVVVVCQVIAVVAEVGRAGVTQRLIDGSGATIADAAASDNLVRLSGYLELAAWALAGTAFLMWLHRTAGNNDALRRRYLRFTPGWAVGWWFVPVLNWVKPFQVMQETWHATDPGAAAGPPLPARGSTPPLLVGWWVAYLAAGFIGVAAGIMSESGASLQSLHDGAQVAIVSHTVGVIGAALAMMVVQRITARQDALHAAVQGAPAAA